MASTQEKTPQKSAMIHFLCSGETSDAIYNDQEADLYVIGSNRNREGVALKYTPLPRASLVTVALEAPTPESKTTVESTSAPDLESATTPVTIAKEDSIEKKTEKLTTIKTTAAAAVATAGVASIEKEITSSAKEPTKETQRPVVHSFLPTGDSSDAIYTPEEADRYVLGKARNRSGLDMTSHYKPPVKPTANTTAKLEKTTLVSVSKEIVTEENNKENALVKEQLEQNLASVISKSDPVLKLASTTSDKEAVELSSVTIEKAQPEATAENKSTAETTKVAIEAPENTASASVATKSGENAVKTVIDTAEAAAQVLVGGVTAAAIKKVVDNDSKEKKVPATEKKIVAEKDVVAVSKADSSKANDKAETKPKEAAKTTTTTGAAATGSVSDDSSDDTSDDDTDSDESDSEDSDSDDSDSDSSDSDEESDSDDSDEDDEEDAEESKSEMEMPEVFLYTSFSSAMINMVSRTNRMAHILESHKIKFTYVDVATDERAKRLWRWKSKGRMLPGIVRDGEIICDFPELEEINEDHEVWAKVIEEEVF